MFISRRFREKTRRSPAPLGEERARLAQFGPRDGLERVRVHVDEPRRDDAIAGVNHERGRRARQAADRRDAIAANADVLAPPRIAGPVEHPAVDDDQVEWRGLGPDGHPAGETGGDRHPQQPAAHAEMVRNRPGQCNRMFAPGPQPPGSRSPSGSAPTKTSSASSSSSDGWPCSSGGPGSTLLLYYGVLGARSAWPANIVGVDRSDVGGGDVTASAAGDARGPGGADARVRGARGQQRAALTQRTFGFDVLACPRCRGRLQLVALIEEAAVIGRILRHLGLPADIPHDRGDLGVFESSS
jgi:hypothetical protein